MLSSLADAILKPIRSLTGGEAHPPDSIAVAHAFIADFRDKYCSDREEEKDIPPFSPFKWADVLRSSQRDGKFVVIYLHSSMHDDTDEFCHDSLLDERVLEFLHSEEVLVWGADVRHRDGSEVAGYLKACSYPFMAVCMKHRQSGSLMVLDRVEGVASLGDDDASSIGEKLLGRLRSVAAANAQVVTQVREVNRVEQERRTFIDQQNRDYEETLLADRERVRVVRLFGWVACGLLAGCLLFWLLSSFFFLLSSFFFLLSSFFFLADF
jgi:FAS-associated factor 2